MSILWYFETISGTKAVTITSLTFEEVTGLTVTEVPESVAREALKLAAAHFGQPDPLS